MTTLTDAEKRLISDCIHGKGDLRWDVVEAIVAAREQAARADAWDEGFVSAAYPQRSNPYREATP